MTHRKQLLAAVLLAISVIAAGVGASTASAEEGLAKFTSAKYPATVSGEPLTSHKWETVAGTFKCSAASFGGTLGGESLVLTVGPAYGTCALGLGKAEVKVNGCAYTLEAGFETAEPGKFLGLTTLVCPGGAQIALVEPTSGCELKITSENQMGFVEYANNGEHFDTTFDVEFKYSVNGKCKGVAAGNYEGGLYKGLETMKGNNGQLKLK